MKKFYTTLALAALVGGSAMAASPMTRFEMPSDVQMKMTAEGEAMYRALNAYYDYVDVNNIDVPGTARFNSTDADGNVWKGKFYDAGDWNSDFDFSGSDYDIFRIGLRKSIATIKCISGPQKGNMLKYVMWYPTFNFFNESYLVSIGYGNLTAEEKLKPFPLGLLQSEYLTPEGVGFCVPAASTTPGNWSIGMTNNQKDFIIMNSNTKSSAGYCYFQYTSQSMGAAVYNQTYCGPKQGARFIYSNFDNETSSVNMRFWGQCTNTSGASIWTYDINYAGVAEMYGYTSAPLEANLNELHIVNLGEQDYDNNEDYDVQWGPLQKYYVIGCSADMTLDINAATTQGKIWGAQKLPENPLYTSQATLDELNGEYFRVSLYCPAGTAQPYGNWESMVINYNQVGSNPDAWPTTNAPEAWKFVRGGWRWPWSQNDGLECSFHDITVYYDPTVVSPFKAFVMNGTTAGFGIYGTCDMGGLMRWKFNGNIVYHPNSANYLETTTLASVGELVPNEFWGGVNSIFTDGDVDFKVTAENGVINVTVENGASVAVYNIAGVMFKNVKAAAGQTVSVNAANGIYLVKVGNKTVKVVL